MISTGIVRSIDSLGRVVLPKELRTTYDITPDTPLEIFTDGDSIIMRKYHAQGSCVFCGDISPDAVLLHGKYVCPARHWASKARSPCYIPAYTKKPVQANCTGSYFWFYSAFFSPRIASSAFLTMLKRLVAWRG